MIIWLKCPTHALPGVPDLCTWCKVARGSNQAQADKLAALGQVGRVTTGGWR